MKEFSKFWQWMKLNNYGGYDDFDKKDIDKKLLGYMLEYVDPDLYFKQYSAVMYFVAYRESKKDKETIN